MRRFIIYALIDPRTRFVRYIGKSSSGLREPNYHIWQAGRGKRGCPYCYNMIRELLAAGMRPQIEVVEVLAAPDALDERERWWIALGKAWGCPLTNLTEGGSGIFGFKHAEATRRKMSASARVVHTRPEVRERHRMASRAALASPEARVRLRAMLADPEIKARRIANIRAANARPGVKEKQGAVVRARYDRPGVRARHSEAMREINARPEVKASKRMKAAEAWAAPETRALRLAAVRAMNARAEVRAKHSVGSAAALYRQLIIDDVLDDDQIHAAVVDVLGPERAGPRSSVGHHRGEMRRRAEVGASPIPGVGMSKTDVERARAARRLVKEVQWGPM